MSTDPQPPASEQPAAPKKNKWTGIAYGFAAVCLIIAAVVRFAGVIDNWGSQVDEANNQIDLAQVAIAKADEHDDAGTKLLQAVYSDDNMNNFPASRATYKTDAEKGITELESSAAGYREAAGLFEKAAGMKVKQPLKDYWSLQAKRYTKLAEFQGHRADRLKAAVDESLTEEQFIAKVDESDKRRKEAEDQFIELGKQADKVKQEHSQVFAK